MVGGQNIGRVGEKRKLMCCMIIELTSISPPKSLDIVLLRSFN